MTSPRAKQFAGEYVFKLLILVPAAPMTQELSPSQAFVDHFRCPDSTVFQVSAELSRHPTFFAFGRAICWARTAQPDASPLANLDVLSGVGTVSLPFNPVEVIDNLRYERYVHATFAEHFFRNAYYLLRTALPSGLRQTIQRLVFLNRKNCFFPKWPLDCSVEEVMQALMQLAISVNEQTEIPFVWFWPEEHLSALMMTHDVEGETGAAHCEVLMNLDSSFGIPGAFQIVPEDRYSQVDALVQKIRDRGFEVNLHDLDHDGRLYEDFPRFASKAAKINRYCQQYGMKGFRAGSMHRNQEWFNLLEIEYDMSVPTSAHVEPQPGGCCTVMPYFVGKVLELPLTTIQDHALFYILQQYSIKTWKYQVERILDYYGLVSFIIHPDYILTPKHQAVYRELLEYIAGIRDERRIWMAPPGDINRWWRQRNKMRLVRAGSSWKIEGEGSHRATIAHASVKNGKLIYRIGDRRSTIPASSNHQDECNSAPSLHTKSSL